MDPQQQPTAPQSSSPQPPLTPSEPPKSKKNIIILAVIAVVAVIVAVIIFSMLGNSNNNTNTSNSNNSTDSSSNSTTPSSDKYQKYSVTDAPSGVTFSVSFYKDAKVEEKNGRTYLNSGETGSMYSIYLGTATGSKIDCGETPTTTMRLGGESTTVCYASDNMQYAGYAKANSGMVKINLAGQQAISLDEAKTIMESVSFN